MACSSCASRAQKAEAVFKVAQNNSVGPYGSAASGTDLAVSLASIPDIGAVEPLIRNHKYRPPSGGWAVEVSIGGVPQRFDGQPRSIANRIYQAYENAGRSVPIKKVWDYLNLTWMQRDPNRSLQFQPKAPHVITDPIAPNAHLDASPSTFGPRLWGYLAVFGMKGHFDKASWLMAISYVTRLLDPATNPAGCQECHQTWMTWRLDNPADKVENEHQAALWVFELHNLVNKKLGKKVIPLEDAVRINQWAFTLDTGHAQPL